MSRADRTHLREDLRRIEKHSARAECERFDDESGGLGSARLFQRIERVAAIAGGKQPGVTVSDAVNALAAVRSVYVSATLGQPVLFEDVLAGKYNDLEVRTGTAAESA